MIKNWHILQIHKLQLNLLLLRIILVKTGWTNAGSYINIPYCFHTLTTPNRATQGINTIIIDNIGMLSRLYKYATVAYVGGGFGADGVHNVLEAAVYGKPVVFGPEYSKYIEAVELIEAGGGISIENALELEEEFEQSFKKEEEYIKQCLLKRR